MQLQFEILQDIALSGEQPSAFHYRENYFKVAWIDGQGNMRSMQADTPLGVWDPLTFTEPRSGVDDTIDPAADHLRIYSYSGAEHWVSWLSEPDQMFAKYKWKLLLILIAYRVLEENLNRLEWDYGWDEVS